MSLHRRLDRLEASRGDGKVSEERRVAVKVLCNEFAVANGEDPEPLTLAEREIEEVLERRFIEEDIPELRRDPGWQSPEARETLLDLGEEAGM